jgi:hypothetical protein
VRIVLAAGQKADAPQAHALIEALPTDIVMADTGYGSDRLGKTIADKGACSASNCAGNSTCCAPPARGRTFGSSSLALIVGSLVGPSVAVAVKVWPNSPLQSGLRLNASHVRM